MKLRTFIVVSIFATSMLSLTNSARAQDEGAMLPDINPQDIEIRGEFRARFLGLDRQPILGFDPKLQVHQIDPNRMPFMEEGDQRVANLSVSELSRPAPPPYTALDNAENINLFARAGVGSFTSPEAKFWGVTSLDNGGYIGGDLDFSSSEGHLEDQPTSFRFLDANAEYGTRLAEKTELRVYGGVQSDFNHPVEFEMSGAAPNEEGVKIKHRGFNVGAELNRFRNDIAGWKIEGNVRNFESKINSDVIGGSVTEWAFNGSAMNRWTLGHPSETIAVEIGGRGGSYERSNGFIRDNQWGTARVGVAYERLFNYNTNVYARGNAYYTRSHGEENYYPGGLLKIDHWFGDRLKITGTVQGKPRFSTVEEVHERNRFLGFNNTLHYSYQWDVTGQASIKYYRGSKLHGGVTYSNTQDRLYFTGSTTPGNSSRVDYYTTNYEDATNFKIFAGITHQLLPERFWVSGQVYIQNPELENGDKVPFEENLGINASVSIKPIDRITLKGWADYVGERENGLNNNTIGDFLLVGSQLDIEIIENIGGYVKLVNITDQSYEVWQGYTERPFQVYGGLTIKF